MKKPAFAPICALALVRQAPAVTHDGKHDAIESIGMDAMTMPFKVKRVALLDKVKVGDHVKFDLQVAHDELSLIHMEKAK